MRETAITDDSGSPLAAYHFTPEMEFETFTSRSFRLTEMANAEVNAVGAVTNDSQTLGGSTPAINSAFESSITEDGLPVKEQIGTNNNQVSLEGTRELQHQVADLARQKQRLEERNRELRAQVKRNRQGITDAKEVEKTARRLLKDFGSKYDKSELAQRLQGLYNSMAEPNKDTSMTEPADKTCGAAACKRANRPPKASWIPAEAQRKRVRWGEDESALPQAAAY